MTPPFDFDDDVIRGLRAVFAGAEAAAVKGGSGHLSDEFLGNFAEGKVDFGSVETANLHLSVCGECDDRLRLLEQKYLGVLRASLDEVITFEVTLEPAETLAARTPGDDLEVVAPLLYCRSFQIDLAKGREEVLLLCYSDDSAEFRNPQLVSFPGERVVPMTREDEGQLTRLRLGPWDRLSSKTMELRFEYEREQWRRRFALKFYQG